MTDRRPFCADLARENGEPLGATASRIDRWFLIEYRTLWTRDALAGSGLSDQVKAHLRAQVASVEHGRLLFVRRPDRRRAENLLVYAADAERASLRCVELETHEELRGVDLTDESTGTEVDHPLFLVCTHGKHDRCCSKYGRPLYDAVREQVDEEWVWQSSHVGGDRFAGNLVALPDGVYYGRVEPGETWPVLDAALHGRVYLPLYRGRSRHSFPAQAAERAVREATGLLGVDDVEVDALGRTGEGWRADFSAGGTSYAVDVRREDGSPTHLTCSTEQLRRPKHFVAGTPRARAS
jgi:hypothetical protein